MKRLLSLILAMAMLAGVIPAAAFAAPEAEYLPENEIDEIEIAGGMFYFASTSAEIIEDAHHGYLLKVARSSAGEEEASVRVTMLGQTAAYGRDFEVKVYSAPEIKVENADSSQSILDVMLDDPDDIVEYNYSDAIIDGTIDPETGEEVEPSEEELDALAKSAEELTSSLLDAEVEVSTTDEFISGESELAEETELVEEDAEVMTETAEKKLSLKELKENATGIKSDKTPMSGGDAVINSPYLPSELEELNVELESAYIVLAFAAGETEKYIEITPIDNSKSNGTRSALFTLEAEENAAVAENYSGFALTIADDEKYVPATVEFSALEYYPQNGYITAYIRRSGDLTNVFELYLDTEDMSAKKGENYSEVHTKVQFPFGLTERHVNIPVRSEGLDGEGRFLLKLSSPSGCEIGDIDEAVGVIPEDAESFALFGNDSSDGEAVLFKEYQVTSEEYGKEMDLQAAANGQTSQTPNSSSYSRWQNDHWEMYTYDYGFKGDVETVQDFKYDGSIHYDFAGWRIQWERKSDKPNYGDTKVYATNDDGTDNWDVLKETGSERWNTGYDNYYFSSIQSQRIGFHLRRTGGGWGTSPTLNIYSIEPIYRAFVVSFKSADPVYLINENGRRVLNTAIKEYEHKADTILENATNSGLGSLVTHSGETVTVSLKNIDAHPIVRIVGINIIDKDGKATRIDNISTDGNSASFLLTNDFLKKYKNSVEFTNNPNRGKKGEFTVQPILENIPATVEIKKDTRSTARLNTPATIESNTNESMKLKLNMGDYVSVTEYINSAYSNQFIWKGLDDDDAEITFRVMNGKRFVGFNVVRDKMVLDPVFMENTNMRVVARVKTEDIEKFDASQGIFTYPSVVSGEYTDFIIADGEADTFEINKYYTLAATPKETGCVSVWNPAFSDISFTQNEFPFMSRELNRENVVTLTQEKADDYYVLTGSLYSEDALNSAIAEYTAWYPAKNIYVVVDSLHYGISDEGGKVQVRPSLGKNGYYIRYATRKCGLDRYRDVMLYPGEKDGDGCCLIDIGKSVIKTVDLGGPYVEAVVATNSNGVYSSRITIDDDITYFDAVLNYRGCDAAAGVPYYDSDGVLRHEVAESVDFIVIDPTTHEEKFTIEGKADKDDPSHWYATSAFNKGKRDQYTSSDMLYVRLTTNRRIGNGKGYAPIIDDEGNLVGMEYKELDALLHTEYAPLNTGSYFVEENPIETPQYEINPELESGKFSLPIIGSLLMNVNIKRFNLGIHDMPGGIRISFGVVIKKWGTQYDGNGNATADTGMVYGIGGSSGTSANFTEGFDDMKEMIKDFGSENKIGKMALGLSVWSVTPFAGIYLDFKLYHEVDYDDDDPAAVNNRSETNNFTFAGAGAYVGISGYFRYTYYMILFGVPFYVGGDVTLTILASLGVAGNTNLDYKDIKSGETPLDDLTWDFTFRATFDGNAYVGVGLCGTLGVRGGFNIMLYFIAAPNVTAIYPDFHTVGFRCTGAIKFWADAVLFSIPIPVYSGTIYEAGYFEDLAKIDEGSVSPFGTTRVNPVPKPRSGIPSLWVANDNVELESTFKEVKTTTMVENVYDAPVPQMMELGDGRILLVYLDDDLSRSDANRTALMYSVYENGVWSDPAIIQDDATADFMPSLCDTLDKVIVTWVSRESDEEYADTIDYARSLEVYYAEFDKESGTFGEIERLTDDDCYDSAPYAVYDISTGDVIVCYTKSEALGDDFMNAVAPTVNNSQLMYMLRDGETGEWVRDRYFENELALGADEETLVNMLGGQRFISSPISDFGITDPVIIDFTADSSYDVNMSDDIITTVLMLIAVSEEYVDFESIPEETLAQLEETVTSAITNDIKTTGVFAYTVDEDNDLNTESDRELFVQFYDFAEHKTGNPIRITNNTVADSNPQLVNKRGELYLFWVEDGKQVNYVNITSRLIAGAMQYEASDGEYNPGVAYSTVVTQTADAEGVSMDSYKAFIDDDGDMFVAFLQTTDSESSDVFVTGYISDDEEEKHATWSDAVRMTAGGYINDVPAMAALSDGRLVMVNNRYTMNLDSDDYETYDSTLVETLYETVGSLDVVDHTVGEAPAKADDLVSFTVKIRNTGVKVAKGFDFTGDLKYDGAVIASVPASHSDVVIYPGGEHEIDFEFERGESVTDLSKLTFDFIITEADTDDTVITELELFDGEPKYEITDVTYEQFQRTFYATATVRNVGSGPSREGDKIRVEFNDIYYRGYGGYVFCDSRLPEIGIGESAEVLIPVNMPDAYLEMGYVNTIISVMDEDEKTVSNDVDFCFAIQYPYEISVNGNLSQPIELEVGESVKLSGDYKAGGIYQGGRVMFYSTDDNVISVSDKNVLTGINSGSAYLFMKVDPYGGLNYIPVIVTSNGDDKPNLPLKSVSELTDKTEYGGYLTANGMLILNDEFSGEAPDDFDEVTVVYMLCDGNKPVAFSYNTIYYISAKMGYTFSAGFDSQTAGSLEDPNVRIAVVTNYGQLGTPVAYIAPLR